MANVSAQSFHFAEHDSRLQRNIRRIDMLIAKYGQSLSLMTIAALGIGLGLTQYVHGRIAELRTTTDILQLEHGVIVENKSRLEMLAEQIGAKSLIVSQAKRKLRLVEPEQRQLQKL